MTDQNVIDKSLRSVFVGNIPYDVTEEKLKDIFSEVGPVVSFKIVYDRETGKPKGYGFCEYRDQETAMSAMRNLNNYEISGRTLRVDNACTEKSRLEMQSLMQEKSQENPYGEAIDPLQAPEVISKAVASLPPDQLFELMKQMKISVQNNPNETRVMLLQNPQLAYALLQALVVMRVVDPNTAVSMLQKGQGPPPTLHAGAPDGPGGFGMHPGGSVPPVSQMGYGPARPPFIPPVQNEPWQQQPAMAGPPAMGPRGGLLGDRPFAGQDTDLRLGPARGDHDLRVLGSQPGMGTNVPPANPIPPVRTAQPIGDMDRRDPRSGAAQAAATAAPGPRDPRGGMGRSGPAPAPQAPIVPQAPAAPAPSAAAGRSMPGQLAGSTDQEKAALIMQVLQLSDEQIALLPPDQRQSIMVLKEQIARSSQPR